MLRDCCFVVQLQKANGVPATSNASIYSTDVLKRYRSGERCERAYSATAFIADHAMPPTLRIDDLLSLLGGTTQVSHHLRW
jgi:hypothetical protein